VRGEVVGFNWDQLSSQGYSHQKAANFDENKRCFLITCKTFPYRRSLSPTERQEKQSPASARLWIQSNVTIIEKNSI